MRLHCVLILICPFLAMLLASGCSTKTTDDRWRVEPVAVGKAWHHPMVQQTAFDADQDGRVDRLRHYIGSGLAMEQWDTDKDGMFDVLVTISYDKERGRTPQKAPAPVVPKAGNAGAFPKP